MAPADRRDGVDSRSRYLRLLSTAGGGTTGTCSCPLIPATPFASGFDRKCKRDRLAAQLAARANRLVPPDGGGARGPRGGGTLVRNHWLILSCQEEFIVHHRFHIRKFDLMK